MSHVSTSCCIHDVYCPEQVEAAAEIMVQAIAEGRRELLMSVDGTLIGTLKAHLGPWLDAFAPTVLDAMLNAEQKRLLDRKE